MARRAFGNEAWELRFHGNLAWFPTHADVLDVYAYAEDAAAPGIVARVRAGRVEMLDEQALPSVMEALAPLPR